MDHRDPPRIHHSADPRPRDPSARRFPGLYRGGEGASAGRRISSARLVAAASAAVLAGLILWFGGGRAARAGLAWLHGQPAYQLRFRDITLEPPPPPWIKVGRDGVLEAVRLAGHWPETLSAPDVDKSTLRDDFKLHCPWAEKVGPVRSSYPNGLSVELTYREPVAQASWRGRPGIVYIDRSGVRLPDAEVDPAAAGPLPRIVTEVDNGRGTRTTLIEPPASVEPGRAWRVAAPGATGAGSDAIAEAARLAEFIRRKAATEPDLARPLASIYARPAGLMLATAEQSFLHWGEAPGSEPAGRPTAEQKWAGYRAWVGRNGSLAAYHAGRPDQRQLSLQFGPDGRAEVQPN